MAAAFVDINKANRGYKKQITIEKFRQECFKGVSHGGFIIIIVFLFIFKIDKFLFYF
jgi:hypothetical protein